jgi:hypothetical protein
MTRMEAEDGHDESTADIPFILALRPVHVVESQGVAFRVGEC